jgi:hypothetical protein
VAGLPHPRELYDQAKKMERLHPHDYGPPQFSFISSHVQNELENLFFFNKMINKLSKQAASLKLLHFP